MADIDRTGTTTLADVAEAAGVSNAAASLALRGKPGVSDSTRAKVLDAATDLGYQPRASSSKGGVVGILVKATPDSGDGRDAFYGPIVAGIIEACGLHGLDAHIDTLPVDDHHNPTGTPRLMTSEAVDGILILGAYITESAGRLLTDRPVVLVDGYAEEPHQFSSIVADNVGGAFEATTGLLQLGHRSITFVGGGDDPFPSIKDRYTGYAAAIAGAGLTASRIDISIDDPEACATAAVAHVGKVEVTALLCANDAVALEVHSRLGDRIPDEISVIGFDDIEAASFVRPALTSVAVDKQAMGRLAVDLLRHRIVYPLDPASSTVLKTSRVRRESTAPPSQR